MNDLGKVASPILSVEGTVSWQERHSQSNTTHPDFEQFARVIQKLKSTRRERAQQFFDWCLVARVSPVDPGECEAEINTCVKVLKKRGLV